MDFLRIAAAAAFLGFCSAQAAGDSNGNNGGSCYEYNVDYNGYDILTLSGVESPALCQDACLQTYACAYWSWSTINNICYLKSRKALLGRRETDNIISGPKTCFSRQTCYSEGVDYVGYDLQRIEGQNIPSAQACQDLCVQDPQCAFFSYKRTSRCCYLKHSGAVGGRSIDEDVVSGPRVCPGGNADDQKESNLPESRNSNEPASPGHYCAEGSVEYKGKDVEVKKNIRTASHCQQLCYTNNKCFFWTWDKNKNTCNLKGSDAADTKVSGRYTLGKVSGAKDCLPINTGCHLLDTTFLGTVVRQIKNSLTFDSCQSNCQNDPDCRFFTWTLSTQLCQLRTDTPFGFIKDSSTVGTVAGPQFCPNDDVCMEQADYVGYDLESIEDGSVPSAIECRSICRQTEGCAFWTWVQQTNNCYLKTEEALLGKRNGLTTLGRYSGPRYCTMLYDCLELNTAYLSATATRNKNIATHVECDSTCKATTGCIKWTYLAESRTCLLLTAKDKAEKVKYDGALSSALECNNAKKSGNDSKCLLPGVKYKDTPMGHTLAGSTDDCHFECMNKATCKVFTFESGAGCTLYNKPVSELTPWPATFPVAVSGTTECAVGAVGKEDGALSNTCYTSNAIEGGFFYAYNPGECADACIGVPGCMYWTYDPRKRADSCILFGEGAVADTRCTGSTSGEKGKQAATYDTFRYDAPGTTVDNIPSLDRCRAECAAQGYAFWTYYPKKKQCVLLEDGNYARVRDFFAACGTAEDPLTVFNNL